MSFFFFLCWDIIFGGRRGDGDGGLEVVDDVLRGFDGAGEAQEVVGVTAVESKFLDETLGVMGTTEEDCDGVAEVGVGDKAGYEVQTGVDYREGRRRGA